MLKKIAKHWKPFIIGTVFYLFIHTVFVYSQMKNSYKTGKYCIYTAYRVVPLGLKANPINGNDNNK